MEAVPAPAVAPDLEFGLLFLEGEGAAEVDGEVVVVEASAAIVAGAFVVWGAVAVMTTGVIGMAG